MPKCDQETFWITSKKFWICSRNVYLAEVNDTVQLIASNDTVQVITQIVRKLEEAMSKKPKRAKQKKGSTAPVSQVDKLINMAHYQLVKGDNAAAIQTCHRVLSYLPQKASHRAQGL